MGGCSHCHRRPLPAGIWQQSRNVGRDIFLLVTEGNAVEEGQWCAVQILDEGQVLSGPSDTPASLSAWIGTAGLGKGTFAMIDFEEIPEEIHPVAKVAFPSKRPGAKPIEVRVVLKERC